MRVLIDSEMFQVDVVISSKMHLILSFNACASFSECSLTIASSTIRWLQD